MKRLTKCLCLVLLAIIPPLGEAAHAQEAKSLSGEFVLDIKNFPDSLKKPTAEIKVPLKAKNLQYALSVRKEFEQARENLIKRLSLSNEQIDKATALINSYNANARDIQNARAAGRPNSSIEAISAKGESISEQLELFFPRWEISSLFVTLANSYCGDCLDDIPVLEKDKLIAIIAFAKYLVERSSPERCIGNDNNFNVSGECERALNYCAGYLNLQGTGTGVFVEVIDKTLARTMIPVNNLSDYDSATHLKEARQELLKLVRVPTASSQQRNAADYLFALCKDFDAQGLTIAGKPLFEAALLSDGKFFDSSLIPISYGGIAECIERATPSDKVQIMRDLAQSGVPMADHFLKRATEAMSRCQENARRTCADFTEVSGTLLYTYTTRSGQERTVAESDIEKDLKRWKDQGTDDGAIARHAETLQHFKACRQARLHDFW